MADWRMHTTSHRFTSPGPVRARPHALRGAPSVNAWKWMIPLCKKCSQLVPSKRHLNAPRRTPHNDGHYRAHDRSRRDRLGSPPEGPPIPCPRSSGTLTEVSGSGWSHVRQTQRPQGVVQFYKGTRRGIRSLNDQVKAGGLRALVEREEAAA